MTATHSEQDEPRADETATAEERMAADVREFYDGKQPSLPVGVRPSRRPTHLQQDEPLTDAQRAIRKRSADLCRAQPALWSRCVQRSDYLASQGVERYEAIDRALRECGV